MREFLPKDAYITFYNFFLTSVTEPRIVNQSRFASTLQIMNLHDRVTFAIITDVIFVVNFFVVIILHVVIVVEISIDITVLGLRVRSDTIFLQCGRYDDSVFLSLCFSSSYLFPKREVIILKAYLDNIKIVMRL